MSGPSVFLDGKVVLHAGDCLDVLATLPENSVDAIITDPPYHYQTIVDRFGGEDAAAAKSDGASGVYKRASAGFMGKTWDGGDIAFRPETWAAALRVLKPGGHMAAFSAPKCVHRMGMAIELAGFEMRDRIIHLTDPDPAMAAFLDSLSVQQAEALLRLSEQFGSLGEAFWTFGTGFPKSHDVSKAIDKLKTGVVRGAAGAVKQETVGQVAKGVEYERNDKGDPITEDAAAWNGWGTALKPAYEPIVIARKPLTESSVARQMLATGTGGINVDAGRVEAEVQTGWGGSATGSGVVPVISGGDGEARPVDGRWPANLTSDGSAARFFYTAKADSGDRLGSKHPTVKPLDLMQWLVRMLTPPGGTVLDLFSGTGTTGEAAWREGFSAILIEREEEYRADIARRMDLATASAKARARAGSRKPLKRTTCGIEDMFAGDDTESEEEVHP